MAMVVAVCASAAAMAAPPDLQVDIGGTGPQEERMMVRTFAPGQGPGWHIHHGVELTYVLSGSIQLSIAGQPPRILHADESFAVPRDAVHEAHAVGDGPATLVVTYAIDKGSPPRITVPAP